MFRKIIAFILTFVLVLSTCLVAGATSDKPYLSVKLTDANNNPVDTVEPNGDYYLSVFLKNNENVNAVFSATLYVEADTQNFTYEADGDETITVTAKNDLVRILSDRTNSRPITKADVLNNNGVLVRVKVKASASLPQRKYSVKLVDTVENGALPLKTSISGTEYEMLDVDVVTEPYYARYIVIEAPENFDVQFDNEYAQNVIKLTWDTVADAYGYNVYYKTNTSDWALLKQVTNNLYYHENYAMGYVYSYKVSAVKVDGSEQIEGALTDAKSLQPLPEPVFNQKAEVLSYNSVKLTWAELSNVTGYKVERSTDGAKWTSLGNVAKGEFTDKNLTVGVKYTYRITSFVTTEAGDVMGRNPVTMDVTPKPVDVTGFEAVSQDHSSIKLSWDKQAGVTGYAIYRGVDDGKITLYKTIKGASKTTFTDEDLTAGKQYAYQIRARKYNGEKYIYGDKTDIVFDVPIPNPAENVAVKSVAYDKLKLTWDKQPGVTGYVIFRTVDGEVWDEIVKIKGASNTTYTDTGLTAGVKYTYVITTRKYNGEKYIYGYDSNLCSATPKPNKVTLSSVTNVATKSAKLTWAKQSGVTGYQIQRSTDKKTWTTVTTIKGASKITYTDKSLSKGETYYYRVRARKYNGEKYVYGSYSSTKSVKISK